MRRRRRGRRRRNHKKLFLIPVLFFLLLAGMAAGFFSNRYAKEKKNPAAEQAPVENIIKGSQTGVKLCLEQKDLRDAEEASRFLTQRPEVRGIYITGPMAGSASFDNLLALVDETELNAMVVDVKNDQGELTFKMDLKEALDMGACVGYIQDMPSFMAKLKEHGIYTIARIPCFKDPILASGMPELALTRPDGTPVTDANGLAWVNPYKRGVWEYLVKIAKQAGELGFDEIQFDYVRFPIGADADAADYGPEAAEYTGQQAICGFLAYAAEELHKERLIVSADVFGTIIGSKTDVETVGQDYGKIASIVDVVSPMVYPSHYADGVFGLKVPDAQPYPAVLAAMQDSVVELEGVPEGTRAAVRPWLQAFTAVWVNGHIPYEGEQIREQIQAVYDAGYTEWLLWNASNRYVQDGLLPAADCNNE